MFAVIMADFYDLPFNDILNWRKFSLVLRERDYGILKKVLQGVTMKEYRILHAGVRQVSFVEQMCIWLKSFNRFKDHMKNCWKYSHFKLTRVMDEVQVRKHFEWHSPPVKYDAFHMVMYELWLRRFAIRY